MQSRLHLAPRALLHWHCGTIIATTRPLTNCLRTRSALALRLSTALGRLRHRFPPRQGKRRSATHAHAQAPVAHLLMSVCAPTTPAAPTLSCVRNQDQLSPGHVPIRTQRSGSQQRSQKEERLRELRRNMGGFRDGL